MTTKQKLIVAGVTAVVIIAAYKYNQNRKKKQEEADAAAINVVSDKVKPSGTLSINISSGEESAGGPAKIDLSGQVAV